MACINPQTLNDGTVVPCGYCNLCLQLKRMDWCVRLSEEQRVSHSSHFITLTYGNAKKNSDDLVPRDLQLFVKRLRRFQDGLFDGLTPIRYYSVGEYGELYGRPHYHSIMFNLLPHAVERLECIWGHGFVHVGSVSGASIGYVTAYSIKKFSSPGRERPFARMSKNPGIGSSYLHPDTIKFHNDAQLIDYSRNGVKSHLPRYFRERIFTPEARRVLRVAQLQNMEVGYSRDIAELRKFHSDPYYYYGERQRFANEVIGKSINYKF